MSQPWDKINNKTGYMPDELVSNYMREKLRFEEIRREKKLSGIDLSDDIVYSNLKKRKTDVLRRIFISMANLIFFFECVAEHEELQRIFEDDLLDLLGLRRNTHELNRPGFIASRLVRSILIWRGTQQSSLDGIPPRKENRKASDFQLILADIFQHAINDKVSMSLPSLIDREQDARKNVLKNFETVRGWTKMLEHIADQDTLNYAPHRTFNFNVNELLALQN